MCGQGSRPRETRPSEDEARTHAPGPARGPKRLLLPRAPESRRPGGARAGTAPWPPPRGRACAGSGWALPPREARRCHGGPHRAPSLRATGTHRADLSADEQIRHGARVLARLPACGSAPVASTLRPTSRDPVILVAATGGANARGPANQERTAVTRQALDLSGLAGSGLGPRGREKIGVREGGGSPQPGGAGSPLARGPARGEPVPSPCNISGAGCRVATVRTGELWATSLTPPGSKSS